MKNLYYKYNQIAGIALLKLYEQSMGPNKYVQVLKTNFSDVNENRK